jgi:hypothetical protein
MQLQGRVTGIERYRIITGIQETSSITIYQRITNHFNNTQNNINNYYAFTDREDFWNDPGFIEAIRRIIVDNIPPVNMIELDLDNLDDDGEEEEKCWCHEFCIYANCPCDLSVPCGEVDCDCCNCFCPCPCHAPQDQRPPGGGNGGGNTIDIPAGFFDGVLRLLSSIYDSVRNIPGMLTNNTEHLQTLASRTVNITGLLTNNTTHLQSILYAIDSLPDRLAPVTTPNCICDEQCSHAYVTVCNCGCHETPERNRLFFVGLFDSVLDTLYGLPEMIADAVFLRLVAWDSSRPPPSLTLDQPDVHVTVQPPVVNVTVENNENSGGIFGWLGDLLFGTLTTAITGAISGIPGQLSNALSGLSGIVDSVTNALGSLESIFDNIGEALSGITDVFKDLTDMLGNIAENVQNFLSGMILPNTGFIDNGFANIQTAFDARIPAIGQIMGISGEISSMLNGGGQSHGIIPFGASAFGDFDFEYADYDYYTDNNNNIENPFIIPQTSPYGFIFRDIYSPGQDITPFGGSPFDITPAGITPFTQAPEIDTGGGTTPDDPIHPPDYRYPRFAFTVPASMGGGTFQLINLSFFDQYRGFIHALIMGLGLFLFIRKILRKLPRMLYK